MSMRVRGGIEIRGSVRELVRRKRALRMECAPFAQSEEGAGTGLLGSLAWATNPLPRPTGTP